MLADQNGHLKNITEPNDIPLALPSSETVSCIKFSPNPQQHPSYQKFQQMMVVAQWDGTVSVWQIQIQQ